jgi:hypothetical protein
MSLLLAAVKANSIPDVSDLLAKGDNPKHYARPLLSLATSREMIALLISYGADVNQVDEAGWSPIFWAPSADLCLEFMKQGADLTLMTTNGHSLIYVIHSWLSIGRAAGLGTMVEKHEVMIRIVESYPGLLLLCKHYPIDVIWYVKTLLY